MERLFRKKEMSETEDRDQERAAADEEVQIIDLEQDDAVAESKRLWLSSALLRWHGGDLLSSLHTLR